MTCVTLVTPVTRGFVTRSFDWIMWQNCVNWSWSCDFVTRVTHVNRVTLVTPVTRGVVWLVWYMWLMWPVWPVWIVWLDHVTLVTLVTLVTHVTCVTRVTHVTHVTPIFWLNRVNRSCDSIFWLNRVNVTRVTRGNFVTHVTWSFDWIMWLNRLNRSCDIYCILTLICPLFVMFSFWYWKNRYYTYGVTKPSWPVYLTN
jgi:hypothetical protein